VTQPPVIYCYSCGTRLPASAAFCPACGCAVQGPPARSAAEPQASGDVPHKWRPQTNVRTVAPYIIAFIILAIVAASYVWQIRSKAAAVNAASSYARLSEHLVRLTRARSALDNVSPKLIETSNKLSTDLSQAGTFANHMHDTHDPYIQSNYLQTALSYTNDARTKEAALEELETQYLAIWQPVSEGDAIRQLRIDLVAGNEATENQISETLRGLDEISDDIADEKHFQPWQYPSGEIVSHYTTSSAAEINATKFRRLSSADAESLVARLSSDVAKTKSQIAELEAHHPDLAGQRQGP
jgi:hypothetical protein